MASLRWMFSQVQLCQFELGYLLQNQKYRLPSTTVTCIPQKTFFLSDLLLHTPHNTGHACLLTLSMGAFGEQTPCSQFKIRFVGRVFVIYRLNIRSDMVLSQLIWPCSVKRNQGTERHETGDSCTWTFCGWVVLVSRPRRNGHTLP